MDINPNVISLIIGGFVTIATGIVLARYSKSSDARAQAEAALIGTGPKIIEEQNKRINSLTEEIARLWERDKDCQISLARIRLELGEKEQTLRSYERRISEFERRFGSSRETC